MMAPLLRYLKHNKSISLLANHFCSYVSLPLYLFDSFLLSTLHLQNKCFWFLWWINNAYIQVYITCLGLRTKNQFMSWILMIDIKTVSYAYTVTNILGPKLCLATNKLFLQVAMTSVFSVFLPRFCFSLLLFSPAIVYHHSAFFSCDYPCVLLLSCIFSICICSSTVFRYEIFAICRWWVFCNFFMVNFLHFMDDFWWWSSLGFWSWISVSALWFSSWTYVFLVLSFSFFTSTNIIDDISKNIVKFFKFYC